MQNYANIGEVNGPAKGTSAACGADCQSPFQRAFSLLAVPSTPVYSNNDPTAASKLLVGPALLKRVLPFRWQQLFGPYWVVAVGKWCLNAKLRIFG